MRRYGSGLISSERHTHLLVSSLRRVLNHLSEHEVLPLQGVNLRLERGRFCLHGAALVFQGGHVCLLPLASLLSRDAIAQEPLKSLALLLIFYVVVLSLRNFVRLRLLIPGASVVVVRILSMIHIQCHGCYK